MNMGAAEGGGEEVGVGSQMGGGSGSCWIREGKVSKVSFGVVERLVGTE